MQQAGPAIPSCPRCQQDTFDFEDIGEGERLVCTQCGLVIDELELVHHTAVQQDGQVQQTGVYVAADDDGQRAATHMLHGGDGGAAAAPIAQGGNSNHSGGGGSRTLAVSRDRLNAGISYLQLPQHVAATAKQLLPRVVEANRASEQRKNTDAATVAATLYLAARENSYTLPLGAAGSALSVSPVHVGREFRRLVVLLQLPMPPPSIEAQLMRAAALVLPHFEQQLRGNLRQQPAVKKALELVQLLQATGATDGRHPALAAAAALSMSLAEQFRDARPSAYAAQVAALLQHDRTAVQRHITHFEGQLLPLLPLLPFASASGGSAGVECVKHAALLLKLQELSQEAERQDIHKQR